ncbi:hypothetical protein [Halorarius litoreus]|uniref:hypothetical protein n=1 Tax=Halorarius litoreus TaxID=2962676 RepID=UPI0020CD85C1|nr:hypothetical protein [Halorarius litoreus]
MAEPATTPTDRRKLVVSAVLTHRKQGTPAVFHADGVRLAYDDRLLELSVSPAARDRLDDLLAEYPVFKVKQPETRKAPDGTVFVSAIADPKHLADFVEDCFRRVYEREKAYALTVD